MDAKAINKWRQANKRLFYQFPSEWVAFSPEKRSEERRVGKEC